MMRLLQLSQHRRFFQLAGLAGFERLIAAQRRRLKITA